MYNTKEVLAPSTQLLIEKIDRDNRKYLALRKAQERLEKIKANLKEAEKHY